jgi:hypothetical protein
MRVKQDLDYGQIYVSVVLAANVCVSPERRVHLAMKHLNQQGKEAKMNQQIQFTVYALSAVGLHIAA